VLDWPTLIEWYILNIPEFFVRDLKYVDKVMKMIEGYQRDMVNFPRNNIPKENLKYLTGFSLK
jgi:hypothetical protein